MSTILALVIPWSTNERGGVSTVVREVARHWVAMGVPNIVVIDDWASPTQRTLGDETHFRMSVLNAPPASVLSWPLFAARSVLHLWRLRRFLVGMGICGVNFHYSGLNAAGVAMLKCLGLYSGSLVLSFHGTDVRKAESAWERWIYSLIWAQTDAVTACSQALSEHLQELHPSCRKKCLVAYNGVDQKLFRPSKPKDGPAPLAKRYGISVGSYIARKGHDVLLQAYAMQVQNGHVEDLVIIGADGPQYETTVALSRKLGVASRVHLIRDQPIQEVARWLRAASWAIQPSHAEPFGLAVIEAAASGTPVAVSNIGGHLEIVTHGVTGLTFEAGSENACSAAIAELHADPAAANRRSRALRREVFQRFTWEGLAKQLKNLLMT